MLVSWLLVKKERMKGKDDRFPLPRLHGFDKMDWIKLM